MDPSYCGECYGAPAPTTVAKPGCCNTCDEVREAYAAVSWSFGRGEGVEQCAREHYSEYLDAQRKEGCRIEGGIRINKVVGNFHFAPGKSFSNGQTHVHDLENFLGSPEPHTFTHTIHHLRFGPQLGDDVVKRLSSGGPAFQYNLSPLDNTRSETEERPFNFQYFIKVVSTAYLPLGWEKTGGMFWSGNEDVTDDMVELGKYGRSTSGSVETNQYSVTSHKRSLAGGSDVDEGHQERIHARGGIPGVFFVSLYVIPSLSSQLLTVMQSYDISPMKVINREKRSKTLSGFLVGVFAVVGGTLTVAAAIDRGLYEGTRRIKKIHDG